MNKPRLSIVIPTIRTHLLKDLYYSIEKSCNRHSFEVIFVGPFNVSEHLTIKNNVTYIKDYGQPSRAAQLGLLETKGELTCWITDDCWCYPETLSNTLELYDCHCLDNDIVGMRFFENPDHYQAIKSGQTNNQNPPDRLKNHPDNYWFASTSYHSLIFKGVKSNWGTSCLFITRTQLLKDFGGWDCQWEHLNHATHDLLFRLQQCGSRFFLTDYDVFVANWYQGTSKDHAPVHYGQLTHDEQLFTKVWTIQNVRSRIDINNWQNVSEIWERRFTNGIVKNYADLY